MSQKKPRKITKSPRNARSIAAPPKRRAKSTHGAEGTSPGHTQQTSGKQKSLTGRFFYWAAVLGVWAVILGTLSLFYLAHDLPDLDTLPDPGAEDRALVIKASNGSTLLRTGPIYGDWLDYEEIPDSMVRALLAIEDRSFFAHLGIDGKGLARAAYLNLKAGRVRAGGSTLTQQLAKNIYLANQRSFKRKAQELLLTFWLERKFTKEQLLTLYLNRVYFGGGAYGIDAAAQTFFGHSARTLSVAESALLAGLVQAPSRLAPHINPDGAWVRAGTVLSAMAEVGALTETAAEKLTQKRPRLVKKGFGAGSAYFADQVTFEINRLLPAEKNSALIVYTTLDPASQRAAYEAVRAGMLDEGRQKNAEQAALIALDHTGAVKALIGGVDYGKSQYNRATQALRQPGSAFKLFPYLAAIEGGLEASDLYRDAPVTVEDWSPKNYTGTFRGTVTAAEAFAHSINTVAVTITENTGRDKAIAMARRLGIRSNLSPVPSLPLGSEEVRLVDLAAAYAAVGSGGYAVTPYYIIEATSLEGEVLYRRPLVAPRTLLTSETVEKASYFLKGVLTSGSGRAAQLDRPAAGKTGTSQDNRDAVFAGFTSDLTAAVWVGNDKGAPMKQVTGGGLPARIWADFMIEAHAGAAVRPLLADAGLYADWASSKLQLSGTSGQPDPAQSTSDTAAPPSKAKKRGLLSRLFGGKD